jgi:hypothetical protein
VFGQSVTFTATVAAIAPGSGTPTGTVTFKDSAAVIGTGTLSSGVATFTTSALAVGGHSITAVYGSDSNFIGSTSDTLSQAVNKADTTTMLSSTSNPSVFGQSVTFTAAVSVVAPGAGTPTGIVTFRDSATVIGTGTLSGGVASFTTAALAVGGHSVTATYGSDFNFNGSTNTVRQTVNKANTTTTVNSSSNPSTFNQAVTFTAMVTAVAPGSGTPTGTVTFAYVDSALNLSGTLGTVNVSAGSATLTTSSLPVNVNKLTATYNGDANFNGTDGYVNQTIQYASGGMCAGDVGHMIRQPINPNGSSVFKQKSTVPAKFAVCDANGASIGTAGVVTSFNLVRIVFGTADKSVNETVDSTTPDTMFRFDPTAQQWIFNMNTKSLTVNTTYGYNITLNDGSAILYSFGLK